MTNDKAQEAAHAAYAKTTGGMLEGHPMANAISAYLSALPGEAEVVGRDIFECANQLGGYVGPNTDEELARFLIRESDAAANLANEIVRLRGALQSMQARAEAAERERDEAVDWTATVERHGADGFDDLAEAWLALPAIQRITNAAISTFSKWANEDLMARFKKNQLAMFHLAFVEGCLAGVRTESVLSKTAEARVKELEARLSEAADEIEIWGAYASEYFQEKHDPPGVVREFREFALTGGSNE